MAIFNKKGESPNPVIPSKDAIKDGRVLQPIEIPISRRYNHILNILDRAGGWIVTNGPYKERPEEDHGGHRPPPPPGDAAQRYSRHFIDSEIEALTRDYAGIARGYANSARDINRKGWNLLRLPRGKMTYDPDGWETGDDIFENENLYGLDGLRVRSHEIMGKELRSYGFNHDDRADRAIRPLEEPMAFAYMMDEKNVADRFTRLAMDALRN